MIQFDQNSILRKAKVTSERFEAIGLNWDELTVIYESYYKEIKDLDNLGEFIANDLMKVTNVHSVRFRSKNPIHLIEKIIRKRNENPDRIINIENYKTEITDLIGVRAIHLMKNQWVPINEFILKKWDLNETPTAYIREGDSKAYTESFSKAGFDLKQHPAGYRSLHYIIATKPAKTKYFVEIQVRTIFEEGWSEIDHEVRYPYAKDNVLYAEFLSIFNRLAGSADEMGSFILNLKGEFFERDIDFKDKIREKDATIKELSEKIDKLKIGADEKADLVESINSIYSNFPTSLKSNSATDAFGTFTSPKCNSHYLI